VSEKYKKSGKLTSHVVNSNIAIGSLPTLQTSHGLLSLFEKIYYGELIFTDFSNIGEDAQCRCFNSVYDVKSVSQPDTIALLGINYCLQIIETGFAEWFYACHRMGPAQILLKISAIIA
jgi:hypothetical protein